MTKIMIIDSSAVTDSSHGAPVLQRSLEERLDAGLILIDKPAGPTSHQVAAWAKDILGIDHLAHGGTLDPFATGLLTLMTGRARRLTSQVLGHDKEYIGVLKVGGDADMASLEEAINSLRGEIYNVPPSESAVKVQVRTRRIRAFEILDSKERLAAIRVACDAGTYIRTLARDLGLMINSPIKLVELRRTRSGRFTEQNCVPMEDLVDAVYLWKEKGDASAMLRLVSPIDVLMDGRSGLILKDGAVSAVSHGAPLTRPGIQAIQGDFESDEEIVLWSMKGEVVAIANATRGTAEIPLIKVGEVAKPSLVLLPADIYPRQWRGEHSTN
ncbi:MAG: RNA-guided pseudouridylation complex pseudouridine synthase subunit Cbf5 [Candidatus Thalassarchaeaceae archaeon]